MQSIDGKCFFLANVLLKAQKTFTIDKVEVATGSEKSPPYGDTAPIIVILPTLSYY